MPDNFIRLVDRADRSASERLDYEGTLKWLRDHHVTWDAAMEMRDLPESKVNEAALREYLTEASVEFR